MQTMWHTWILNAIDHTVHQRHGFAPYETSDPDELVYEYEFIFDSELNEVPV